MMREAIHPVNRNGAVSAADSISSESRIVVRADAQGRTRRLWRGRELPETTYEERLPYLHMFGPAARTAHDILMISTLSGLSYRPRHEWLDHMSAVYPNLDEYGGEERATSSAQSRFLIGEIMDIPGLVFIGNGFDADAAGIGPALSSIIACGIDWLGAAFPVFAAGYASSGGGFTLRVRDAPEPRPAPSVQSALSEVQIKSEWDNRIRRGRMMMIGFAADHMGDIGFPDVDMESDPITFGWALAKSWCDIRLSGITDDDAYLFPSVSTARAWHRAVESSRDIPLCASTANAMAWLEGERVLRSGESWISARTMKEPNERDIAKPIVRALESDGRRDYSHIRSLRLDWPGEWDPGSVVEAIRAHPDSAAVLGTLDVCDVLTMATGGDPSCPVDPHPSGGIRRPTDRPIVPPSVIDGIADMLERGCPKDMVVESVRINRGKGRP